MQRIDEDIIKAVKEHSAARWVQLCFHQKESEKDRPLGQARPASASGLLQVAPGEEEDLDLRQQQSEELREVRDKSKLEK